MISKLKKPVSILLVFMMIVSLVAAVPMTVNAAPPGGGGITSKTITLYANNGTDQSYSNSNISGIQRIGDPLEFGFTTPDNKTFSSWNTQPDGTGADYGSSFNYNFSSDLTLYAQWVTLYTVTWNNWDDTELDTYEIEEGATPTYDGEVPAKAADGDHMYVFSGWTPELAPVTEDVTYTATFASSADLVEITDHETDLDDLGFNYEMVEWGRSMTAQEAITLAQYMSAQNDGAKCAVLYEAVDDYVLYYAMSDGTTGSRTGFSGYALNDFLPDYKVYYLPVNLNSQTIELNLNPDNASVIWYDATDSDGYWSMEAAYNDGCYLVLKCNSDQPAGTYEWADMGSGCGINDYDASKRIDFVDGSCTVTVNEDVVTVSGTFTGSDRNTYVVTVTHEAPYYTITAESVNGAVTAGVNGADVTKAKAGKTVLLNVAPADGYQLKSITASAQKTNPEDFSDLVALMGDAVFDGDENYDCGGYTCKVENGKFVVYNGTTLVTELSESNMTGFNGDSDYYVEVNSDNVVWNFYVENGEITGIDVMDADADYDIIFSAVSGSKSTGTLQPVQVDLTTVAEGSQYSFTMPAKNVTVKAEFEEAAPAPELPDVIADCTYRMGDNEVYANVPYAEEPADMLNGAALIESESGLMYFLDANSYTYKFYDAAGNEITPLASSTSPAPGSEFSLGDVTVTTTMVYFDQEVSPLYVVATKLFVNHSVSLGGDIGVNFYINSAAADFANAESAVVKFTCDGKAAGEVNLKEKTPANGRYRASCDVVAAQMAHKVYAEVWLNGKMIGGEYYSVQQYAETVFANPAAYDDKGKPDELKALAKALLNYGAMAQTVFDSALTEHPDLPTGVVGVTDFSGITADDIAEAIKGEAFNVSDVETALGAKFYTSSLIYLSRNTLRLYFTPTTYPGEIPNSDAYDGNLSGYYYYVDHANIPAAELDNQQTFNVNGTEFTFSALDYAKAVVESTKMEPEQQNLAKALYLYNQAANAYFDDEEPAPHTHDFTYAADGATITATCNGAGTCDIDEGLSLTISAPTGELTANGTTTFPATLSTGYNTTAFPDTYTISYTKDGQPFDGTPTEAGAYTASVTVGTATASVSYTVAAPVVNYTYWVGPFAQYEHSPLLSVGTELHTGDRIAWEGSGWNQYQVLDSSNNNNQIACFEDCDGWSVTGNYRVTGLTRCFDTDCDCLIYLEPIANN